MKRVFLLFVGVIVVFLGILYWSTISEFVSSQVGLGKKSLIVWRAEIVNPNGLVDYTFVQTREFESRYTEMMKALYPTEQFTHFVITFADKKPVYSDMWGTETYGGYTPIKEDKKLTIEIYLNKAVLDKYRWNDAQVEAYVQYLADRSLVRESLLVRGISEMEETEKETQKIMTTFTKKAIELTK